MKRALIACAAAAALLTGALAQEPKTPAGWVAQLGAEKLQDRDAASAALLSLGPKARDAVRDALDSTDPEVQSRAKDLWKTLRWLVVPDADEDIKNLVAEADKGAIDQAHWQAFVQKYGAESIRLVAEFNEEDLKKEDAKPQALSAPATDPQTGAQTENRFYPGKASAGYLVLLQTADPVEVARVIARTDNADDRAALQALLDGIRPEVAPEEIAVNWMRIQIALWNYQKAYDFGRDYSFHTASYQVVKECAVAADRGGLFDKIQAAAKKEIASETDPNQLCAKLSFYTGLFTNLEKKPLIDPLFDMAQKGLTARADDAGLRRLVETLLSAGMAERAIKALHDVQSAQGLYMRSAADLQMQNEPVAAADWGDAMQALDAVDDSKKKETWFDIGELMHDWHDGRAVFIWQKILAASPANTVYDANACFRMGEFLETQSQYAGAAQFYEKGMAIASKITNGIMVATGADGRPLGGQDAVLDKIRELKSRAAQQQSIFAKPPAPDGGNDGSQ